MNGPPRYNYEQLRNEINNELLNKNMPNKLYESTDSIFRIINTIVKTDGKNWAAHVLNNDDTPLLTSAEQQRFTEAIEPYIPTIIDFFGSKSTKGGAYKPDIEALSGMSKDFIKTKISEATGITNSDPTKMFGPDNIYDKMINKIGNIDSTVNDYASKYGILRLEKEHDLEPDPRLIPQPVAASISEGLFTLSTAAGFPIPPNITLEVLSKIKIPFRTIIFIIFLALDVTRIAMAVTDRTFARKILSIVLSILELLQGDWKKAILTFIGFYGTMPLLAGQIVKVFLTLFRRLSPQIQYDIIYGSLDATKSLMIGILLSIFQVTAPEEVRLPLIGILEKIAKHKAEMDGVLVEEGLSARPDYLSPTFEDLNNIQAVMSDKAYICSCEFEELVKAVNKSSVINIVLQILRIPVTEEFKRLQCGDEPCKDFVHTVVKESLKNQQKREELQQPITSELPFQLNPDDILTKPVSKAITDTTQQVTDQATQQMTQKASNLASQALTGAITSVIPGLKPKNETEETREMTKEEPAEEPKYETKVEQTEEPKEVKQKKSLLKKSKIKGGRILHSRRKKQSIA